jgi:tight adherence protein B
MNSPLLMVGLVTIIALVLIALGLSKRNKSAAADEVIERMGRFASREEFLAVSESGGKHQPSKVAQGIEEMFKGRTIANDTAAMITRADVKLTVGEFLMLRVIAAGAGVFLGYVILARIAPAFGILLGLVLALVGFTVPNIVLSMKAKRRNKQFVSQLGETITLMANSLRAGYSLLQTMEMVSRETKDPIGTEFKRVVREVGLGISHHDAMENLHRRVPSDDLDLLVTAINIQHEVGGNLAQILTTIGHTIRERVRIKGEIQVLTAQVQLSGYIITAMPIALAAFIFVVSPNYLMSLFAWPWICMPIGSLFMIFLGYLAMKKIANIEV